MKKLLLLLLFALSIAAPISSQTGAVNGYCNLGATKALTSGLNSSNSFQGLVPSCTVTVYINSVYSVKNSAYTSGGTVTGTRGQTCALTFVGGGTNATGTVALTGTNTIGSGSAITIVSGGYYSTAPTAATLSSGTATCSGTAAVSATMTPALATIYADSDSTALPNPFTANVDASWLFYAANNQAYDISMSGGIPPYVYPSPVTIVDLFLPTSSYGGTVTSFSAPAISWPSWLVPTVTNSTIAPTLTVAASAIPNAALANDAIMINSQSCVLGSSCTLTAAATNITVGTTAVSGGTSGYVLYNNGGTLGNLGTTGSGNVVLGTSPTISGLTVTSSFAATGLVTNADLASPSISINGIFCTLGSSCAVQAATGTQSDVTGSRAFGSVYTAGVNSVFVEATMQTTGSCAGNNTYVYAESGATSGSMIQVAANGVWNQCAGWASVSFLVPAGYSYEVNFTQQSGGPPDSTILARWVEITI